MSFAALGLLTPAIVLWSARRGGERWSVATGLVVAGVALSLVGGVVAAFYLYLIDISAGLCGSRPAAANLVGRAAYAIVIALAVRHPRRVWVWPLAVLAGAAASTLVAYWFSSAHAYCET